MVTIYWGKHCQTEGPEHYNPDWSFANDSIFHLACAHVRTDVIYKNGEEFYIDWETNKCATVLCIDCALKLGYVW